jgi:predicted aldo/keto reductase-like oxidoreductase
MGVEKKADICLLGPIGEKFFQHMTVKDLLIQFAQRATRDGKSMFALFSLHHLNQMTPYSIKLAGELDRTILQALNGVCC